MGRERVYSVQEVAIQRLKTNPPSIRIDAEGIARSTGWTSAELVKRQGDSPPTDGIYEFEFTAIRPTGITMPELRPVSVSHTMDMPEDLRRVRVLAETDQREASL